jgi:hypothetical protein
VKVGLVVLEDRWWLVLPLKNLSFGEGCGVAGKRR